MPVRIGNVLSWDPAMEADTIAQASRAAELPFIAGHVALMPDAHVGLGCAVGAVIPTSGAIIPAAVGVDIGCGMIAVETTLTAADLPDDMGGLLSRIERVVPAGVGRGRTGRPRTGSALEALPRTELTSKQLDTAASQMGTLGPAITSSRYALIPQKPCGWSSIPGVAGSEISLPAATSTSPRGS
jgi:tRNA-splicing ligase RtcB